MDAVELRFPGGRITPKGWIDVYIVLPDGTHLLMLVRFSDYRNLGEGSVLQYEDEQFVVEYISDLRPNPTIDVHKK